MKNLQRTTELDIGLMMEMFLPYDTMTLPWILTCLGVCIVKIDKNLSSLVKIKSQ